MRPASRPGEKAPSMYHCPRTQRQQPFQRASTYSKPTTKGIGVLTSQPWRRAWIPDQSAPIAPNRRLLGHRGVMALQATWWALHDVGGGCTNRRPCGRYSMRGPSAWTYRLPIGGRSTRCAASDTTHSGAQETGVPNQFPRPMHRLLRSGLVRRCCQLFSSKSRRGA